MIRPLAPTVILGQHREGVASGTASLDPLDQQEGGDH